MTVYIIEQAVRVGGSVCWREIDSYSEASLGKARAEKLAADSLRVGQCVGRVRMVTREIL